ncbi:phenolic acid decarboxylase, partial [Kitasatospora sp. MAP5-34]|uniref:phenolic acid decarboxylase n=1 Tax=Kitasatospora sp. MAP5-34 TaxID=3035102 RepID=UPI002476D16A
ARSRTSVGYGFLITDSILPREGVSVKPAAVQIPMVPNGTKLHLAYETGYEFDVEYIDPTSIHWVCTAGPAAGRSETETVHSREVAPGLYWYNWLEPAGTTVSQLLDLNTSRVTAFMTFDTSDGKKSLFHSGPVTRI